MKQQIQKRVDLFLHSSSDYVFYVGIEWPKKKNITTKLSYNLKTAAYLEVIGSPGM